MIFFLTLSQISKIHDEALIYGGLPGVRDRGALESSIEMPKMTAFGQPLYPGICDKAAAYLYYLVQNHPFNDGNKRTGAASAQLFLRINNVEETIPDQEYEDFVVEVAQGNVPIETISAFFRFYTKL